MTRVLTSVKSLYEGLRNTKNFYCHDGMYINDIWLDANQNYIILYANGKMTTVSADTKIQVVKT